MTPTDIAILSLLITGLIFSIIEIGLSAYSISYWEDYYAVYYGSAPGFISFILFASLWTVLRTTFRLLRLLLKTRSPVDASGRPTKWVPIVTLVVNAVTMVFWLAAFAAYVNLLDGATATGLGGAILAFAVMLVRWICLDDMQEGSLIETQWLLFLALLTLNILTMCGVLRSDIRDYASLRSRHRSSRGIESKQERGAVPVTPVPASEVQ